MQKEIEDQERDKYNRVWTYPNYRVKSHSVNAWTRHKDILFPKKFSTLLDIGCGTGRLIPILRQEGIDAHGVDISENAPDPHIKEFVTFSPIHLMEFDRKFDVGICTDVMEHIPTGCVEETLERIHRYCKYVVYAIATTPSSMFDDVLHLTVFPRHWWERQLEEFGQVLYHGCLDKTQTIFFTVETCCDKERNEVQKTYVQRQEDGADTDCLAIATESGDR